MLTMRVRCCSLTSQPLRRMYEKKDGLIPEGISAESFFLDIIELTLQRAAPDAHMVARKLYLNRSM